MELTKQTLNGICTCRDSPEFKQPDQSFNSCSLSLQKEDIDNLLNDWCVGEGGGAVSVLQYWLCAPNPLPPSLRYALWVIKMQTGSCCCHFAPSDISKGMAWHTREGERRHFNSDRGGSGKKIKEGCCGAEPFKWRCVKAKLAGSAFDWAETLIAGLSPSESGSLQWPTY